MKSIWNYLKLVVSGFAEEKFQGKYVWSPTPIKVINNESLEMSFYKEKNATLYVYDKRRFVVNRIEEFIEELLDNYENHLEKFIRSDEGLTEKEKEEKAWSDEIMMQVKRLPPRFMEYSKEQITNWAESAYDAYFNKHENIDYIIKKVQNITVIVPVDFQNTGTIQGNSVMSNGLQQFLQLKHQLYLSPESVT